MAAMTGAPSSPGSADPLKPPYAPKADGFRDTIESIVIALIFAFVFRAFVVEAFVIPTGSMAPTLYGLHGQHRCACCDYPYAYGIREEQARPTDIPMSGSFATRCPNCGFDGHGNEVRNLT